MKWLVWKLVTKSRITTLSWGLIWKLATYKRFHQLLVLCLNLYKFLSVSKLLLSLTWTINVLTGVCFVAPSNVWITAHIQKYQHTNLQTYPVISYWLKTPIPLIFCCFWLTHSPEQGSQAIGSHVARNGVLYGPRCFLGIFK